MKQMYATGGGQPLNKRAFTLIELLAVIVILAIIALIATPIILNIIEDAKSESNERSAENYLEAVELAVAKENMEREFNPTSCEIVSEGDLECDGYEGTIKVEVDGEVPNDGRIYFKDNEITIMTVFYFENFTVTINTTGKIEINAKDELSKLSLICKPAKEQLFATDPLEKGYKYECDVDPSKEGYDYMFYVLSSDETSVNLIMDRNMYYDSDSDISGIADATNKGIVEWHDTLYNEDGPVGVMDTLYNITKNWTNVPDIVIDYSDENIKMDGITKGTTGYGKIITENGITKITKRDGTPVTVLTDQEGYTSLKARLPYYSEVSNYDASLDNGYLYDNISCKTNCGDKINYLAGISGYWTLTSTGNNDCFAWTVDNSGKLYRADVNKSLIITGVYHGVRPVINLKF